MLAQDKIFNSTSDKIIKYPCRNCDNLTKVKINCNFKQQQRTLNLNKHFILCKRCKRVLKLVSHSSCKKDFLLKNSDIQHLEYLYFCNKNNHKKLFLMEDIQKIISDKYGTIEALNRALEQKHAKKQIRNKNKRKLEQKRKEELLCILTENKIELSEKLYGDYYSYIYYGTPDLDTILTNEINKMEADLKKRIKLADELSKKGIPFDEQLYEKYIHNDVDLFEIVKIRQKLDNNNSNNNNNIILSFD